MSEKEENPNATIASPAEAQTRSTITLEGRLYPVCSEEEAREILAAGKVLEGVYVKTLSLGKASDKYREKILIKGCFFGELDFEGASFCEMVQIQETTFEKEVKINSSSYFDQQLGFTDCQFHNSFLLKNTSFPKEISFTNTYFHGVCILENSRFAGGATLVHNVFEKKITLKNCRFDASFSLAHSRLQGDVLFWGNHWAEKCSMHSVESFQHFEMNGCDIGGEASFENFHPHERCDLEKSFFRDAVRWNNAIFGNKLVVKNCIFYRTSLWANTRFQNCTAFPGTRFEGEVSFDGATFEDLAFFKESYMESVHFRGVTFREAVDFEKFRLGGEMLCQGTEFEKAVSFNFMETEGKGRISFNANFKGPVDFYRATFKGPVWFLGTQFQDAFFVNTTFEGPVYFSFDRHTLRERNRRKKVGPKEQALTFVSLFHGRTNFTNALFYRKAVFENVFFEKFATFENTYFAEEINFQETHFLAGATFRGSFCTQELNFTKAVFDEYVNFDLANINRRLNLTNAAIDKGISFYHAVIDVVVVERDQIEGRLIYEGSVKGQEDKKHFMRVKEEYLILKESFHQRGKFDEEDWAYYQYRVNDRKSFTEKAWRSLLRKPILAKEDDIPEEERENDSLLIDREEKALRKEEKNLEDRQKKLQKIQKEQTDVEHPKQKETWEEKIIHAQEEILEIEKECKAKKDQLAETMLLVQRNTCRLQKLHESKDKPFSFLDALAHLLQNAWWKLVDWGTGYGVRPFRIGLLAFAVILIFAVIYAVSGVPYPYGDPAITMQASKAKVFVDWIYFSAMAFATSNLGGDIYYNEILKFFLMSESLLGLFLMALFVGCYTRKIMR